MNWQEARDQKSLEACVLHYLPASSAREVEMRVTLLRAREYASVLRGRTEGHLSSNLAAWAHEVAGEFVYRPDETEARLDMAATLCRRLAGAAIAADGLHSEEYPL